jgi:hypothetical protein
VKITYRVDARSGEARILQSRKRALDEAGDVVETSNDEGTNGRCSGAPLDSCGDAGQRHNSFKCALLASHARASLGQRAPPNELPVRIDDLRERPSFLIGYGRGTKTGRTAPENMMRSRPMCARASRGRSVIGGNKGEDFRRKAVRNL